MLTGYLMYYFNPLMLVLGILNMVHTKYYLIYPDKEIMTKLDRKIRALTCVKATYIIHDLGRDLTCGLFMGRSFVAFMKHRGNDASVVYLLSSAATYAHLMEDESRTFVAVESKPKPRTPETSSIQVYVRKGCFKSVYYSPLRLNIGHLRPLGDQQEVLDGIDAVYRTHERATIFLHGAAGTGKSSVGYFVARNLRGKYCHSFNPSDPGDTIISLIDQSDACEDSPLVVVLEEVDELLLRLHAGITRHAEIPISVHNKATWTAFLDDMIFYKHVVLICTSNRSKDEIDILDPAYLRPGRIHAVFKMTPFSNP